MPSGQKIIYAGTRDQNFFPELWTPQTYAAIRQLKLPVTIPDFSQAEATPENWRRLFSGAAAIITTWQSPRIDRGILEAAPDLRIVGHAAGSVADYVSAELFGAGVKVTSANNDMAHAVAEWCLMGALMGKRNVLSYTRFGDLGQLDFPGRNKCGSLHGATIGIWGFGAVARHLTAMLKPLLPANILVSSSHLSPGEAAALDIQTVDLDELLRRSDVIFTLTGLNAHSRGRLGKERLSMIRDGAVLVNGGRGELIDENALYPALAERRFTAVLDVYHQEPLPPNSPLFRFSNVILTPHNAGFPSRHGYIATILEEIDRCFRGQKLRFEVQPEQIPFMSTKHTDKPLATCCPA